jgi:hypothetical protein
LYCDIWIHAPEDNLGMIDESHATLVNEEAAWAEICVAHRGRDDMGDRYVRTVPEIDANHHQVPGAPAVQHPSVRAYNIHIAART